MGAKSFHYGDAMGFKALREALAGYLRAARSVRCEAEQVMITSGSQQALEVSARVPPSFAILRWLLSADHLQLRVQLGLGICE
jgi:histidinol-phosphate/aromatic aminotransferase/cobyric acid decarboxylase-like protein